MSNINYSQGDPTLKLIHFLERYLRVIQRTSLVNYRKNLLKSMGLQLVNELVRFYSQINYNKDGLSKIFMDIAKYKSAVAQFGSEEVENKFKLLRSLIDIYVIKLDEKIIEDYVQAESLAARVDKDTIIQAYIKNKVRCERK